MIRLVLLALCLLLVSPVRAGEGACVPAADLLATAQAALAARAQADGVAANFTLAGRVVDLGLPASGAVSLRASEIPSPWLRPRLGVGVLVFQGDRKVSTVTVWFAITAPAMGAVYDADYPKASPASQLQVRSGSIDLARTHGAATTTLDALATQRLRRPVSAGQPVLAEDFEPMPAVQAQQSVRIESAYGLVRLTTRGQALSDGAIGQTIAVLPADGDKPVRARVVSSQVVSIEN